METQTQEATMTESSGELLKQIDKHLQEQQAELAALRVVQMAFVTRLLGAKPEFAEEALEDLKRSALAMLGNMTFEAASPETTKLAKTHTAQRLELLFQDFASALSQARTIRGEAGRH